MGDQNSDQSLRAKYGIKLVKTDLAGLWVVGDDLEPRLFGSKKDAEDCARLFNGGAQVQPLAGD